MKELIELMKEIRELILDIKKRVEWLEEIEKEKRF